MQYDIECTASIDSIGAAEWDALRRDNHPLLSHAFLHHLEKHGCLTERTGWQPRYLTVKEKGRLIAAMPLYQKNNSWGEFVFDHAWADAYARNGIAYYPKLVAAIPFSPVHGQKLIVKQGREAELEPVLLSAAIQTAKQLDCSSLHILFPLPYEQAFCQSKGMIARHDCQYHWRNQNYDSFDAFMANLSAKKRKNIRQERSKVQKKGITIRVLDGDSANSEDWENFTLFYNDTYERKWGAPIFNQAFFEALAADLGEQMVLMLADYDGRCIAGALMYKSDTTLYGRHWGCLESHDALHFELCYYQGIEYCIANNLDLFEPGAQGAHKLARGFDPIMTASSHALFDQRFLPAVKQFSNDEKEAVAEHVKEQTLHTAYKKDQIGHSH